MVMPAACRTTETGGVRMKDGQADGAAVEEAKREVHCSVCGELIGRFKGNFIGETRCKRCKRDLRFRMQNERIVLECDVNQ